MSKYIIGGGISGLLYAYMNPQYTIIEAGELGGKLNQEFFKNIIYLHHTKETEKLLLDLNIKYSKRTQLIKYLKNGKLTQDINKQDKVDIIKKKMSDDSFEVKDLNLSTSDYYINILEFNFKDMIDIISKKVKVIKDAVIRITDTEIVTEKTRYEYSQLVSTIPAPVFWKLYYKENHISFDSKPVTFVLCDKEPEEAIGKTYDMIYVLDNDKKYVRVSKKPGDRDKSLLLYEFTGNIKKEEVLDLLPAGSNILEYYVDYRGIIYTNKNNFAPKNCLFVGRFATYNHSDKQQDVLKAAEWDYDFRNLWSRQGHFSSQLIDFNKLNSVEDKEKYTHKFILHLFDEVSEILNETNYKDHHKREKVDTEKVHEEIIDAYKYLLNLCLVWGLTPEKFIKMFNDKTDIVEKRYAEEFTE